MKLLTTFALTSLILLCLAAPAFAGVSVTSPVNGSTVSTTFTISAAASSCSNQAISTIGFSMDSSTYTATVKGSSLNTYASAAAGGHTIHFKAWGVSGALCLADVGINVTNGSSSSSVPSNATTNSGLQTINSWSKQHDTGTPGSSSGWTGTQGSPSRSGVSREFATNYSNYGGERYTLWFGDDTSAQNFMYDGWVYIAGSNAGIANIEMDLNQVMPNGQTVIFGFQCSYWSGTWDYTANKGTPTAPNDQWVHSSQACNPRSWGVNQWHHVQIQYSRDNSGYVSYNYVILDGKQQNIGVKVLSAFALGWAPTLMTNFQIDGVSGSGSSIVYLDELNISRW